MRRCRVPSVLLAAALLTLVQGAVRAESSSDYSQAWQALKSLAGTWSYTTVGSEHSPRVISYHVTSGGSVVFEEFLGRRPGEIRTMATAYHLDVSDLVATHYCGAGNQPRMKATSWDAEARILRFDFWDITHLAEPHDYYTVNIELRFESDEHVELRFRGREKGELEDWQIHQLRRLSGRVFEVPDEDTDAEATD